MKYIQNTTKLSWEPGSERACLETHDSLLLAMSAVVVSALGVPLACCEPTMFVEDLTPTGAHRLILKHFWSAGYDTRLV